MPTEGARRTTTLVVASVLAVLLATVGLLLPVPYVEFSPGVACNVVGLCRLGNKDIRVLQIPDKKVKVYPTNDRIYFTTVSLSPGSGTRITLYEALRGWFDKKVAVLPSSLYFGSQSAQQIDCQAQKDQQASQNNAIVAALRVLKYRIPVRTQVYVAGFSRDSPARAAGIGLCDDIVTINGTTVHSERELTTLIRAHRVGETLRVGYVDNGVHKTARVQVARSTDSTHHAIIGVEPAHIDVSEPPFDVTFDVGNIGGPSAGLMYAVGIIDLLTPGDLTGGVVLAGTGTIDAKGTVGAIGGIQQKLYAARARGATVFLVPKEDCGDALRVSPKGLRLASVTSLSDALNALKALRHEPGGTINPCTR